MRRMSANESSAGDISMTDWTAADIPPLNGKTAVITGATGGLGYETALALAGPGALLGLPGPNEAHGRNSIPRIPAQFSHAQNSFANFDQANRSFIAELASHL